MKVLIIGDTYKYSSTGQIAALLLNELTKRGHECKAAVRYTTEQTDDCIELGNKYEYVFHSVISNITGFEGRYSPIATRQLIKYIEEYQPDVIQLFNLHAYYLNTYRLFAYLKKKKIKVVYSMLDEYAYLGHCCYAYDCDEFKNECRKCQYQKNIYPSTLFFRRGHASYRLKKKAYDGIADITFTGPEWVVNRAKESSLLYDKKLSVIDEPVDVYGVYFPRNDIDVVKKYKIDKSKVILLDVCVFSDPRKGAKHYLEVARQLEYDDRFLFIHVGYDGGEELPRNYIPIEYIRDQNELANIFSLADLFICTSMADSMPNTCIDALACGCPICGFDISGVPFVADDSVGTFVEAGNADKLKEIVLNTEKKTGEIRELCRKYAIKRYSAETFTSKLLELYEGSKM